eukprot:Sdes_comp20010_c0_seq3m12694
MFKLLRNSAFDVCKIHKSPLTYNFRYYSSKLIFDVDEKSFDSKVLQSEVPVLVDFHASWCGPCKRLGPILEKVVESSKGAVKLAKVDVDENIDLAAKYEVESLPTVFIFMKGEVNDKFVGLKEESFFQDVIGKLTK